MDRAGVGTSGVWRLLPSFDKCRDLRCSASATSRICTRASVASPRARHPRFHHEESTPFPTWYPSRSLPPDLRRGDCRPGKRRRTTAVFTRRTRTTRRPGPHHRDPPYALPRRRTARPAQTDAIRERWGEGDSHKDVAIVERLLEMEIRDGRIELVDRPPVWFCWTKSWPATGKGSHAGPARGCLWLPTASPPHCWHSYPSRRRIRRRAQSG